MFISLFNKILVCTAAIVVFVSLLGSHPVSAMSQGSDRGDTKVLRAGSPASTQALSPAPAPASTATGIQVDEGVKEDTLQDGIENYTIKYQNGNVQNGTIPDDEYTIESLDGRVHKDAMRAGVNEFTTKYPDGRVQKGTKRDGVTESTLVYPDQSRAKERIERGIARRTRVYADGHVVVSTWKLNEDKVTYEVKNPQGKIVRTGTVSDKKNAVKKGKKSKTKPACGYKFCEEQYRNYKTMKCCDTERYCSRRCQIAAWKLHREQCTSSRPKGKSKNEVDPVEDSKVEISLEESLEPEELSELEELEELSESPGLTAGSVVSSEELSSSSENCTKKRQCSGCGKEETEGKLKKCSECRKAFYCNLDCQRQHWDAHKLVCRKKNLEAPGDSKTLATEATATHTPESTPAVGAPSEEEFDPFDIDVE